MLAAPSPGCGTVTPCGSDGSGGSWLRQQSEPGARGVHHLRHSQRGRLRRSRRGKPGLFVRYAGHELGTQETSNRTHVQLGLPCLAGGQDDPAARCEVTLLELGRGTVSPNGDGIETGSADVRLRCLAPPARLTRFLRNRARWSGDVSLTGLRRAWRTCVRFAFDFVQFESERATFGLGSRRNPAGFRGENEQRGRLCPAGVPIRPRETGDPHHGWREVPLPSLGTRTPLGRAAFPRWPSLTNLHLGLSSPQCGCSGEASATSS
jgi:hypothetical protein